MNSMYDILTSIVGVPANDYQSLILYMVAGCVSVLVVYFVIALFRLTGGLIGTVGRR